MLFMMLVDTICEIVLCEEVGRFVDDVRGISTNKANIVNHAPTPLQS